MFSATTFVAAGAIVALVGGILLVAQPFDRQAVSMPGAATEAAADAEDASASVVKGYLETHLWEGGYNGELLPPLVGLGHRSRDQDQWGRLEVDDARLTGDVTFKLNIDWWDDEGQLWWGTLRIENDGGAWEGTHLDWLPALDDTIGVLDVRLTGSETTRACRPCSVVVTGSTTSIGTRRSAWKASSSRVTCRPRTAGRTTSKGRRSACLMTVVRWSRIPTSPVALSAAA